MDKETELTNKGLLLVSTQLQMLLCTKSVEFQQPEFIDGIEKTSAMLDQLTSAMVSLYK